MKGFIMSAIEYKEGFLLLSEVREVECTVVEGNAPNTVFSIVFGELVTLDKEKKPKKPVARWACSR
ncbi:MAG: hypothetical protein GKR86_00005, partial [Ilumatobacter sp.]|nr:hypothetical protein [Ilumatobacter sp.]